jgi:RNA polymerase sigma-70 factor (ECF subfamily)
VAVDTVLSAIPEQERALIEGFLAGDRTALAEIDRWLVQVIRHRAWRFSTEHDDLLQECRFKLLRAFEKGAFHGRSSLKTFVQATAKHTSLDAIRTAATRRSYLVSAERVDLSREPAAATNDNPHRELERGEELRLCHQVLTGLPEHCRLLFRLLLAEGKSYEEVASAVSIATGTVKSRVARCRDRAVALRRVLIRDQATARLQET